MKEHVWMPPRKRTRDLGAISSGKFVMFVIDSILMGEVVESMYTIRAIQCRTQRDEWLVHRYARRIWEEPDATRWLSRRIVRLNERNDTMKGNAQQPLELAFEFEKSTKNTHKYAERPAPGQPPRIGALYLQKWALGDGDAPGRLTVTVEAASAT